MGPFTFLSWMKITSIICFSVSSSHLTKKNTEHHSIFAFPINPDEGGVRKGKDDTSGASTVLFSSPVSCWDNCLDDTTLTSIDFAGKVRSHGFTTVFDRYDDSSPPRSILESAIVSLLEQMEDILPQQPQDNGIITNDDTTKSQALKQQHRYIEYWWRDASKPRMLEVHRDVDEELCRKVQYPVELGASQKIGKQRCPTFGHVLYVNIHLPNPNLQAPTLVWEESGDAGAGPPRYPLSNVWVVPARTNRLLRFRGDCLHAVCYPPLEFLKDSSPQPTKDVVVPQPKKDEPTNYDQQGHQGQQRRAVLLFNTWEDPPLYPPIGRSLSKSENSLTDISSTTQHKQQACFQYPVQPQVEKDEQPQPLSPLAKLSVPLLGDMDRRGCPETHLESYVDPRMAEKALTSKKDVHCLPLYDEI